MMENSKLIRFDSLIMQMKIYWKHVLTWSPFSTVKMKAFSYNPFNVSLKKLALGYTGMKSNLKN